MQKSEKPGRTGTLNRNPGIPAARGKVPHLFWYGLILFAYASLLLLFCTRNSPLFAYQQWIDPNIYMDVGKAVRKGLVLYRDVFDHKGPLLLLVFAVLSIPSQYSMIGLYLLLCLTLGISLVYLFRTACLFVPEKTALGISLVFPFFLLNTLTYSQGGGSAEELLLPCFVGSLYYLIRFFLRERNEGTVRGNFREMARPFFLLGGFAGIVLLVKINLTAFFLAMCGLVFLRMLFRKQFALFLKSAGIFLGGIAAACLPAVLYFAATDSFREFFDVYILFNLKYAGHQYDSANVLTFPDALSTGLFLNLAAVLCTAAGIAVLAWRAKRMSVFGSVTLVLGYAALLVAIYISRRAYQYEYIPLTAFAGIGEIGACFGLASLWAQRPPELARLRLPSAVKKLLPVALFLAIVATNGLYPEMIFFKTNVTGVERIAASINDSWEPETSGDQPSILLYNSGDQGFFQLTGCTPEVRVFYMPMMNYAAYPDLVEAQNDYVTKGLPDYVITVWYDTEIIYPISEMNPAYRIIAREEQNIEGSHVYITLFAKE